MHCAAERQNEREVWPAAYAEGGHPVAGPRLVCSVASVACPSSSSSWIGSARCGRHSNSVCVVSSGLSARVVVPPFFSLSLSLAPQTCMHDMVPWQLAVLASMRASPVCSSTMLAHRISVVVPFCKQREREAAASSCARASAEMLHVMSRVPEKERASATQQPALRAEQFAMGSPAKSGQ